MAEGVAAGSEADRTRANEHSQCTVRVAPTIQILVANSEAHPFKRLSWQGARTPRAVCERAVAQ